jgi:hypothetical protein
MQRRTGGGGSAQPEGWRRCTAGGSEAEGRQCTAKGGEEEVIARGWRGIGSEAGNPHRLAFGARVNRRASYC